MIERSGRGASNVAPSTEPRHSVGCGECSYDPAEGYDPRECICDAAPRPSEPETPSEPMTDERLTAIRQVHVEWGASKAERDLLAEVDRLRAAAPRISEDIGTPSERLRAFVRCVSPGGCKKLSLGDDCTCPLCDIDRLALDERIAALTQENEALRWSAYRAGFIDGGGGTPKGHGSDFGARGYESLVAYAESYATRYTAARAALATATPTEKTSDE